VILDELRTRCAELAAGAGSVRVVAEAVPALARALAATPPPDPDPEAELLGAGREATAAYWLCLDAINFGSGWFPSLRKRPGRSGYFAVAIPLRERFAARGPWRADELVALTGAEMARVLGQDARHPLMELFAGSLRSLGERVGARGGTFAGVVDGAAGSAAALVSELAGWPCFADPFLKRAQLAAWDLHRSGVARFGDVDRLTCFADNLVPHVLRVDGVLALEAELAARIDRGQLLEHGSREEVELRAGAVHAVELLAAELSGVSPAELDLLLWNRGQGPRYRSLPRPRCRCTAY
jgi:hypothetical protein